MELFQLRLRRALLALLVSVSFGCSSPPPATNPPTESTDGGDGGTDPSTAPISGLAVPGLGDAIATEPTIAVSSSGPVGIAWLARKTPSSLPAIGVAFSSDRGATWSEAQRISVPAGRFAGNEILQVGADGAFFLSVLGVKADQSESSVYLAKTAPGSTELGEFVAVSDATAHSIVDAPALTIASDQSLNVVYSEYGEGNTAWIVAARSVDKGATWTRTVLTGKTGGAAWPNLCAGRGPGRVVAVYVDGQGTGVRWSDDNGATWPVANRKSIALPAEHFAGEFPSCVTEGADFWVLQGVSTESPTRTLQPMLTDVVLAHSGDTGASFETLASPVDAASGPKYMRAMASLSPDKSMSLVYYAGTKDNDTNATVRRVVSADGGKTFSASEVLFSPFTLTTSRVGQNWAGDLLGVTSDAKNTFATYVDNQGPGAKIRFSRLK